MIRRSADARSRSPAFRACFVSFCTCSSMPQDKCRRVDRSQSGGHLRLLRHARRLGGRRAAFLYELGAPGARTAARRASCASAGRRSSSSSCRARTAPTRRSWRRACAAGRASAGIAGTRTRGRRWSGRWGAGSRSPTRGPPCARRSDAGLRLVIVSNTDQDILEHTLRQLELPFDGVTVAEDCRAYKPRPTPVRARPPEDRRPPEQVLHVAFGYKYDIGPAKRLGHADRVGEQARRGGAGRRAPGRRVARPLAPGGARRGPGRVSPAGSPHARRRRAAARDREREAGDLSRWTAARRGSRAARSASRGCRPGGRPRRSRARRARAPAVPAGAGAVQPHASMPITRTPCSIEPAAWPRRSRRGRAPCSRARR